MATRDDYMTALRNADAAGDTAAATQLAARVRAMDAGAPPAAPKPHAKDVPSAADKFDPTEGFGTNVLIGAGKAVTDMGLGARQLGNSLFGIGDKEALAKEAADKAKTDASIMDTAGGMVGKYGTDIATSFLPTGGLIKGAQAANRAVTAARAAGGGAKFLPLKTLLSVAPGAATGAAQGALTPDEDYDPLTQAGTGAALGAAGDVGGRVLGRIAAPFHGVVDGTLDAARAARYAAADKLQQAGMLPKVLAAHLLPDELSGLTAQVAKTHGFKGQILAADEANRAALTQTQARLAGVAGPDAEAISTAGPAMKEDLNDIANTFRATQGDVPVTGISKRLQDAHDAIEDYAKATSQTSKAAKLSNAADALAPIPQPPLVVPPPPTQYTLQQQIADRLAGRTPTPAAGPTTIPRPAIPQTRTVDELMDLRNAASKMAYGEQSAPMAAKFKEMQNVYENSIRKALPEGQGAAFDDWLKQYGAMKDFNRAAVSSTRGAANVGKDTLDPVKTFEAVVRGDSRITPAPGNESNLKLLAQIAPGVKGPGAGVSSDLGRTLATFGLAPTLGGAVGAFTGDDVSSRIQNAATGAVSGAVGMKGLAKLLSTPGGASYLTGRYAKSSLPELLQALRQASVSGAIERMK